MKRNVLNLQVVMADGTVVHTAGPKGRARYVLHTTSALFYWYVLSNSLVPNNLLQ